MNPSRILQSAWKQRRLPFVSTNMSPPTVREAVDNILVQIKLTKYNSPPPSTSTNRHVLNCLVTNEPGVLSRVSGILAGRGFNINSLVVAKTEVGFTLTTGLFYG